jgi:hypothetical protein
MSDIIQPSRRVFFGLLTGAVAAPMIIRAAALMPVRVIQPTLRKIAIYNSSGNYLFTRLDVLYGRLAIQPEWAVALDYPI